MTEGNALLFCLRQHDRRAHFYGIAEDEALRRDGISAGFQPRIVEDSIDQLKQIMAGLMDEARIFTLPVTGELATDFMRQHVGKTDDGIERRAQLVANGSQKAALADSFGFQFRFQHRDFIEKLLFAFQRTANQGNGPVAARPLKAIGAKNRIAIFD